MKKIRTIVSLLIPLILMCGCNGSHSYIYDSNELEVSESLSLDENSIYFDRDYNKLDIEFINQEYLSENPEGFTLFEPLKMLADYKTNTDSPFLPDSPVTVYIRESGKTYLVRSDFSKMTKGLSVKSDSILTVYFYPIVRKDGNSNVIVKTIEKERDTYVDGIYEIRYVDRNNPSYWILHMRYELI